MPRDGSAEMVCACSGVRTVLSMLSRRKASPIPVERPSASAKARFLRRFGPEGEVGTRATSTMRKLFDLKPAVTPASFNLSSKPSESVRFASTSRFSRLYSMALSLSLLASCFCCSSALRSMLSRCTAAR